MGSRTDTGTDDTEPEEEQDAVNTEGDQNDDTPSADGGRSDAHNWRSTVSDAHIKASPPFVKMAGKS